MPLNWSWARPLWCKHLLKDQQGPPERLGRESPQPPNEAFAIYGSDLVEDDMPDATLESARDTKRVGMLSHRHRRDDEGAKVSIQLIGGNNNAGSRLLDFAALRWTQTDKIDLASTDGIGTHHCQSSSSKRVEVGESSRPASPRLWSN